MLSPRSKLARVLNVVKYYLRHLSRRGTSAGAVPIKEKPRAARPGVSATRAATCRSEVIIDAEAQDVGAVAVVHAGDRKSAIRQVHIQIFAFDRPGRRDAIFRADAAGPARHDVALDRAAGLAL